MIGTPPPAQPQRIGEYRILDLIGEGGSGSVYRAEREVDGYTQQVALKLLRTGLRDPAEQARFRRERRILARLEHPAIARLIDGGFTAEGVPWFALEYVEGEPITRWCDARRLDVNARLRLFCQVCEAVEAAHRALIVHRDIKPANILVDTQGRPRLLDFGIAKLLDDSEREDDTRTGLRRLTPAYAAPEQFSGGVITTATDVYALGVLLHELLGGQRPGVAGVADTRNLSQKIGTQSAEAAQARGLTPRQLAQRLRGELDLIVATALAADPARRYPSVAALAADLQAHLHGRPVSARPASAIYKTKKFLLRHRAGVAAAVLVLLTGVAGVAATWRESARANAAAAEALQQAQRTAAVKDFLLALFAGVSPDESKGRAVGARELIERGEARLAETLATHPELKSELSTALAGAYRQLGALERAFQLADQAVAAGAGGDLAAAARLERARVQQAQGLFDGAESDLRRVLGDSAAADSHTAARLQLVDLLVEKGQPAAARQALDEALAGAAAGAAAGTAPAARLRMLAALGPVQFSAGDVAGAETSLREALQLARTAHGEKHTQTARIEHDLAVILLQRGATEEAAQLLAGAEATRQQLLGEHHPDLAQTRFNLAVARQRLGDVAAATALYQRALENQRRSLGPDHPDVANSLNSLALLAWSQGDADTAIARLQEALDVAQRSQGGAHPSVATMLGTLSGFERYAGRLDAALSHARQGLALARTGLGETHYLVGVALVGLASSQNELGDGEAAAASYREGLPILDAALGNRHPDTLQARAAYADLLLSLGDRAGAQRESDQVQAALGELPAGHPRRARLELVALRLHVAAHECAQAEDGLAAAAASLAKGGSALLPDLASAQLLLARCQTETGNSAAAQTRSAAQATLARLPYLPRRLRAERG
nr:serine/threonine-protein kinase [Tahibacter harae]